MDILLTVSSLLVLFALILAPPVIWWRKDSAVDRRIREAEQSGRLDRPAALWTQLHRGTWSRDDLTLTGDGGQGGSH
jgi:hypothetical protein